MDHLEESVAKQEQVQRHKQKSHTEDTHIDESNSDVSNAELAEKTEETLESIEEVLGHQDDLELLADIDDLLESNAEEFVSNYVQQGGE